MNGLRDKYQTDIDENALYSHALKHNIGNLDAAYAHMTYADLQDKAKNSDIVEEKRAASIIEDGSGSAPGTVSRSPAPLVHCICPLLKREFIKAYKAFVKMCWQKC